MIKKKYKDYQKYIDHQSKVSKGKDKLKACSDKREERVACFKEAFQSLGLSPDSKALCIGARFGEEVEAAASIYEYAIGIDIVPHPPLVVLGDMHDLAFEDNMFDLVYSNAIDHAYSVKECFSEKRRVLKPGGILLIDNFVQRNAKPNTSSVIFKSIEEIVKYSGMDLVKHTKVKEKVLFGIEERLVLKNR